MLGSVSLTRVSFGVRVRDRFYVLQLLLGCVSLTRVSFGVRVRLFEMAICSLARVRLNIGKG